MGIICDERRLEFRPAFSSGLSFLQSLSWVMAFLWVNVSSFKSLSCFSCCFSNSSLQSWNSSHEDNQGSSLVNFSIFTLWDSLSSKIFCFNLDSLLPSAAAESGRKQNRTPSPKTVRAGIVGEKLTRKYENYMWIFFFSYGPIIWIEKQKDEMNSKQRTTSQIA